MTLPDDDCQEESYIRIKVLGKGAFGEAVLYRKPENNFLVVWKEIDLNRVSTRNYVEVQNEIEILSLLNHANIVAYYNHYFHENMLYIEMEYANGGTLFHKIANQRSLFEEEIVLWFSFQILSAIGYVHEKNILHRDIKTLNIFLNKSSHLKVGDFGMSKLLEENNVMADTIVGTPYYMSPELIKGQKYNTKSDIWAVGCVLYEILTLKKTFMASNTLKLANDILKGEIEPIDSSYSSEISDIVMKCFELNPDDRPSASEILDRDIFKANHGKFHEKFEELKSITADNRPVSRGQGSSYVKDPTEFSSTVPVITQSSTEVFFWGGGKTQPQMLDNFVEGKSALSASIGEHHIAIVTIENELFTWLVAKGGDFQISGQLGHGDNALYKAPKLVNALEGIRVRTVACGCDFTCCVTDAGNLYTCGSNYFGCLGVGKKIETSSTPMKVALFDQNPIYKISCGDYHVGVLTLAGDVFCWGCGEFGRLGSGSEDEEYVPKQIVIQCSVILNEISCGFDFTLFLTANGKLLACGSNEFNKLGMNQVLTGVAPEKLSFDTPCVYSPSLVKPLNKYRLTFIAAGKTHSAVIDDAGHLYTFGSNEFGQLGQGDSKPRSKVVQVKNALAGKRVIKVSCGDGFTVAVTADNQVYSWGLGENGRLGMDLSLQTKGLSFTSLPRSIFGTLYKVKNVCSRGWNTVLIAEKVFSQKSLRPSSGSGSRPASATSAEKTNAILTGKRCEFKELLSDDVHILSLEESELEPQPVNNEESSSIPTWLAQEMDNNELIPIIKTEKSVIQQLDIIANQNSADAKVELRDDFDLIQIADENELVPKGNQSTNGFEVSHTNLLDSTDGNKTLSEIESLRNENNRLCKLLNDKDKRIFQLESQLFHCVCKRKLSLDSEEIFDV